VINRDELVEAASALGLTPSESEMDALFRQYDVESNDELSLGEFDQFVRDQVCSLVVLPSNPPRMCVDKTCTQLPCVNHDLPAPLLPSSFLSFLSQLCARFDECLAKMKNRQKHNELRARAEIGAHLEQHLDALQTQLQLAVNKNQLLS